MILGFRGSSHDQAKMEMGARKGGMRECSPWVRECEYGAHLLDGEPYMGILNLLEQAVDLRIDAVDHFAQILGSIHKIEPVHIEDEQFSLSIGIGPGLVTFVEAAEVIDGYGVFIFPSPFVDLVHQIGDGTPEVDQKIRGLHQA